MARNLLTRSHHASADERRGDTDVRRSPGSDGEPGASRGTELLEPVTPYDDFRGTNWGACFFGWLVAVAVTLLLGAAAGAVAAGVGAGQGWTEDQARSNAGTVALVGVIALAVIAFVGYYAGGYVAGRMSRFDAARQGLGVWLIGLLTLVIAAGVAAMFGNRYHWADHVDRSSISLSDGQLTLGGVVAVVAVLAVMLLGALLGSVVGGHYHRRIDRVAVER